jgi:hypothetical protein
MRERLPPRRDNRALTISWRGHRLHVAAGLTRDGRVLEVFVRAGRPASDVDQLADDAAVLISHALQFGDSLADLARGIGRLPGGEPASLFGAIVDALLELQGEQ